MLGLAIGMMVRIAGGVLRFSTYLRPDKSTVYLQPDGASRYTRP